MGRCSKTSLTSLSPRPAEHSILPITPIPEAFSEDDRIRDAINLLYFAGDMILTEHKNNKKFLREQKNLQKQAAAPTTVKVSDKPIDLTSASAASKSSSSKSSKKSSKKKSLPTKKRSKSAAQPILKPPQQLLPQFPLRLRPTRWSKISFNPVW